MMDRRSLLALSGFLFTAPAAGLAHASPPAGAASPLVLFLRPDGQPEPLGTDSFAVIAAGSKLEVVDVQGPESGLLVFIIFDLTESIANAESAKSALVSLLPKLPAHLHLGLLRAQDGLTVLFDPTNDRDKAASVILALPVSGKAGLLSTVENAQRVAWKVAAKARVRVATLYITDSDIRNYREDFVNPVINSSDSRDMSRRFPEELVQERISRLSAKLPPYLTPLFIVHLDYATDRLNQAYQTGLLRLANDSGGEAWMCRSRVEIPEAIAAAFRQMQAMYRLDLQPNGNLPERFLLEVSNSGRILRYRSQYEWKGG